MRETFRDSKILQHSVSTVESRVLRILRSKSVQCDPDRTTRAMRHASGPLLVNADASGGSIRVEVLGPGGRPLPGYSARDCAAIRSDGIAHRVRWRSHDRLPDTDEPIRLRFVLVHASLYSFLAGADPERVGEPR